MAKFHFKLEPLLRYRQAIEDQRRQELANIQQRKQLLEQRLESQQRSITDSKHNLSQGLVGAVDLTQISRFAQYNGQVELQARSVVQELAQCEKQIAQARQRLVEATRDRRAIEVLRTKQLDAFNKAQEAARTAELDEISTQQYMRDAEISIHQGHAA